jgi:serine/threonine-protein kinase RsbT
VSGMTTVRDAIATSLARHISSLGIQSILSTLPPQAGNEVGSLDVVASQEVLARIEAGVRVFGARAPADALREARGAITGGRAAPASVAKLQVKSDSDVLAVQRQCQLLLRNFFSATDCIRVTTAASELARNIYMYAREGSVELSLREDMGKVEFQIVATDKGPGIRDLPAVLSSSYTSKTGLGKGLKGVHAMLDEVTVKTGPGQGTTVCALKRVRRK